MHLQTIIIAAFSASLVSGHGVITWVKGANGVDMPGLAVIPGTPRDCSSLRCGAQADSSIIIKADFKVVDPNGDGVGSPLGQTPRGGGVLASRVIADFMGPKSKRKRRFETSFGGFFGGPFVGKTVKSAHTDTEPARLAPGAGRGRGLPTTNDNNSLNFIYHQVDGNGGGPYVCEVDPTTGGTDQSAFMPCHLTQNIPGIVPGFSLVTKTDFDCVAQFPQDMVCRGEISGVKNVCVFKIYNNNPYGPFGSSGAFTQSPELRRQLGGRERLRKRGSPFTA
ncbi:hypothetical protein TWF694_006873 [Orbilia ellipsospora]|uniref:Uncharacterized protein n=1 Tax=Orbilia ellipsospora TaxID=2528407 RepID=A0AAV9XLH1_9PEZI